MAKDPALYETQCPVCTIRTLERKGKKVVCTSCGSECIELGKEKELVVTARFSRDRNVGSGRRLLRALT